MPLGNDIIDRVEGAKHRPQYYQRQQRSSFHQQEVDLLEGFEASFWLLWAIKEATFKAVAQAGRVDKRFNPKDFELIKVQQTEKAISYAIVCEEFRFEGLANTNEDYVHAISWINPKPSFQFRVLEGDFGKYQQQSNASREHAIIEFAAAMNTVVDNLTIEKDHNQIPHFQLDGVRLQNQLSLSHHGRFVSYAFTL